MKKNQKMILIICIIIGVIIIGAGALYFFVFRGGSSSGNTNEVAYVDSVAQITGLGSANGTQNRYSGVVEAQESMDIKTDIEKKIKDMFVQIGDEVTVGTPLLEYETDDTSLKLQQSRIDLEGLANEISGYYNQITELQKEKAKAPAADQLEYTTQIQTAQLAAKRAEYNKKSKEAEITKLEKDMANATLISTMDGVIKAVNTNGETDNMGNPKPLLTIMAVGDYRVKGKINEQNVWTIQEGQPVIIRSRINSETTWTGTISKIDTQSAYSEGDNNSYGGMVYNMGGGGSGESGQTSTNYAFYVTPDSGESLMLGQHLFIELNNGQDDTKDGLWLSSMYMELGENEAYIWAANSKNRLEKRKVELGDYDSALDQYEIVNGLTVDEYIAFPGNLLHEGMECVINDGTHSNSSMDESMGNGENGDMNGNMDNGMNGDMDNGMVPQSDGDASGAIALPEGNVEGETNSGDMGGETIPQDMNGETAVGGDMGTSSGTSSNTAMGGADAPALAR